MLGRTIDMVRADERPSEVLTAEVLRLGPAAARCGRSRAGRSATSTPSGDNVITFGIGPAGTGKWWLAVAMAVQALQAKQVERIILTRPAVEAGERLGFLPGDLMAKVDPYLRPLYDALYDMVEPEGAAALLERGAVEVAPLAFMRGPRAAGRSPGPDAVGLAAIGELEVGDLVVGSDGRPTPVLGVFPQGRREVFRVRAQDGAETLACAEHLWFVRTPDDKQARQGRPGRSRPGRWSGACAATTSAATSCPLVSQPVQFEPQSGPDGSVRARAAARRRLPDDEDDAVVHHRRPGAGRGAGVSARRDRAGPEERDRLRASPDRPRRGRSPTR